MTAVERRFEDFWKALGSGDLDAAEGLYAADAVVDLGGLELEGRPAVRRHMESFRRGFPDASYTVHRHRLLDETLLLEEWTCEATHGGVFARRPATGARIEFRAASLYTLAGDVVKAERTYVEMLSTMVKIGALEWAQDPQR